MEFFLDPTTVRTFKPLGVAALGLAAIFTIAYVFNRNTKDEDQESEGQIVGNRGHKPAGIVNEGNTCFVNSLLQALAPLKSFVANLKELIQSSQGKNNPNQQLLKQLKQSLQKINKSQQSIQITKFLSALGNFSQIINMQQQDAYQLFSIIVDSFEKVYNENKMMASLCRSTLSAEGNELEENFVHCSASVHEDEGVSNTLLGYTKTSIVCQVCQQEVNIKLHAFYNLSFDISQKRIHTLEDALGLFQEKQQIEGFVCTNCSLKAYLHRFSVTRQEIKEKNPPHAELLIDIGRKIEHFLATKSRNQLEILEINESLGNFVKQFQKQYLEVGENNPYRDRIFAEITAVTRTIVKQCIISKYPKILVIHLKQLSMSPVTGQPVLLRKYINFPNNLQVQVKKRTKNYELVSVISHSGNQSFGHYFTFRKLNSGTQGWYFISDTSSMECRESFLKAHMPYMLFYQLVQHE